MTNASTVITLYIDKVIGGKMRASGTLYRKVFKDIEEKIRGGIYLPGDKIESLSEIQKNYSVSKITATRVIDELEKNGMAKKVQGKGTFVLGNHSDVAEIDRPVQVKRLVLLASDSIIFSRKRFEWDICKGVFDRCEELSVPLRTVHPCPEVLHGLSTGKFFDLAPDEGVVFYFGAKAKFIATFVWKPHPWVIIDSVAPQAKHVVTDNYEGIKQLLAHLKELGHKNIAFAPDFSINQCFFNTNERFEAFLRLSEFMEINPSVIRTKKFDDIYDAVKKPGKNTPTALLFPHDAPALNCIDVLNGKGIKVPDDISVCGYDDYSGEGKSLDYLTTVRVKKQEMGMAAVDLLLNNDDLFNVWKRIKPELIVRKSTGYCK